MEFTRDGKVSVEKLELPTFQENILGSSSYIIKLSLSDGLKGKLYNRLLTQMAPLPAIHKLTYKSCLSRSVIR